MSDSEAPPQGLDEKIAAPVVPRDTTARQTLKQLRTRLGSPPLVASGTPDIVAFLVMDKQETWTHSSGTGESAVYELRRSP